ncbi:MAG: TlpA family protein disulfide reductase [Phycisphaera sp.]|nr:MAG: TlpA family protein disulfide reductase [Phycisphaera sp.]
MNWIMIQIVLLAGLLPSIAQATERFDPQEQHTVIVELLVPGGALPFECDLQQSPDGDLWHAAISNGDEVIGCRDVDVTHHTIGHDDVWDVRINLTHYDTELQWTMVYSPEQRAYRGGGILEKTRPSGRVDIPLSIRGPVQPGPWQSRSSSPERFLPIESVEQWASKNDFSGRWRVQFSSSDDPAIGVFDVDDMGFVNGTFLTETGDYRFLAGRVDGTKMRMSCFDGAHAFLFHATMREDGTLRGDFWSGTWWHETWTAIRDDNISLPDAYESTEWLGGTSMAELVFVDEGGQMESLADALEQLGGSVRVVEVFGTWCPNCIDAAKDLKQLEDKYHDRGLRVLGLAFEHTEDVSRSTRVVRAYKERYGLGWPVLIAGLSNKAEASKAFPVLDRIRTYPTLIFLDENNELIAIHAGYTGPATGEAYDEMIAGFENLIENNLD